MKNRIALLFVLLVILAAPTVSLIAALSYDAYAPGLASSPPVVIVHWQDITATDEDPFLAEFHTVGWLVSDTVAGVIIASSWDEADQRWCEFNAFPKGCVLSITEVR